MSQIVYQSMNGDQHGHDDMDDDDEDAEDQGQDFYGYQDDYADGNAAISASPLAFDQEGGVGFSVQFKKKNKSIELAIDLMIKIVI